MEDDIYKVCCIIDFDGFGVKRYSSDQRFKHEFLIREIGFVKIDPEIADFMAKSFRFDLTFCKFAPGHSSWRAIHYQSTKVNGLSFAPQPGEVVHSYNDLHACVQKIYQLCATPERQVVAFKGGHNEREVLDELDIPNLDLSAYGCPKYEALVKGKMVFSHLRDCGHHKNIADHEAVVHCPMSEVTAFKDWLLLNYPSPPMHRLSGNGDRCGTIAGPSSPSWPADSSSDRSSSCGSDSETGLGPDSPRNSCPASPGSGRIGSAPSGP